MSAYIKTLKNTDGDIIYPQTKSEAIYNNDGVNIGEQLNESANKADKKIPATIGNLASLDAQGNLGDSGKTINDVVNKSTLITMTLLAASWSESNYIVNNNDITATNVIELYAGNGITDVQRDALTKAKIISNNQNVGSITLTASVVPIIDIPIILIIRKDT